MRVLNFIGIALLFASTADSAPPAAPRLLCQFCQELAKEAILACQSAHSVDEVKTRLQSFCAQHNTGVSDFLCKQIMDDGVVYVWDVVSNGGGSTLDQNADAVCSCVGLCTSNCKLGNKSQVSVIPLTVGSISPLTGGYTFIGTYTLIRDGQNSIVVDVPSGPDDAGTLAVMNGLAQNGLTPAQIQTLIITHGHPDHFGHDSLFLNARQYFNFFSHVNNSYTVLHYQNGVLQLTTNVQIWQTPGHTPQDVSLIVKNIPQRGTIAVTGDLFFDAADALNPATAQVGLAWDIPTLKASRKKVLCSVESIVPGHGALFQVTAQMRTIANCNMQ